jgi:formamidopyrimidine-DNA glycosylase
MPELPEVETIRRVLTLGSQEAPSILERQILSVDLSWERTLATPNREEFERRIQGQHIQGAGRRGKYLILQLSQDFLLVHLRMSGDLSVVPTNKPPAPHDRLLIELEGGWRLAFNDTRKFGRVWLVDDPQEVLSSLGPEPLAEDFTPEELHEKLHAHKRQLKPLLMDQSFLAGLGNIYTDEALHLARLHPLRKSNSLTETESRHLWGGIRQVLQEGIRRNGASIDWVYRGGEFQNYFRVYGRAEQPCPVCGTAIARIVVGQRGTHYCPACQVLPQGDAETSPNE